MLSTFTLDSVDSFLAICKREIPKGNCYFVGTRILNIKGKLISAKQALLDIGIMNTEEIWKYILELKKEECVKVDFDHNPAMDMNSEIYIFKKTINNKIIYIKLTMRTKGIICISFHEDY